MLNVFAFSLQFLSEKYFLARKNWSSYVQICKLVFM